MSYQVLSNLEKKVVKKSSIGLMEKIKNEDLVTKFISLFEDGFEESNISEANFFNHFDINKLDNVFNDGGHTRVESVVDEVFEQWNLLCEDGKEKSLQDGLNGELFYLQAEVLRESYLELKGK